MKTSTPIIPDIDYPESDGEPMAESDPTRDDLIDAVEALRSYSQDRDQVDLLGHLFIDYEKGNPKAVISPDVFGVFDVSNQLQLSYKVWEENNKVPDFVIEFTSKSTVSQDRGLKKGLYAFLGVTEDFQYFPTQADLKPAWKGYRLMGENYIQIQPTLLSNNELNLYSKVLGLELQLKSGSLRFYNPVTQEILLSYLELKQAHPDAIHRLFSLGLTV